MSLAGQVLADYETSEARDVPGLALVWADQLADVLRKLAAARQAGPAGELAYVTSAGCPAGGPGGGRPGWVRGWLDRIVGAWAGRVTGRVPEPRVVLSVAERVMSPEPGCCQFPSDRVGEVAPRLFVRHPAREGLLHGIEDFGRHVFQHCAGNVHPARELVNPVNRGGRDRRIVVDGEQIRICHIPYASSYRTVIRPERA